jgi:colicin import membrane protein
MQAVADFAFPPQREPALMRAFVLAAVMHGALIGLLFVGVRFQSHAPDTVEVELWEPPPPAPPQPEVKPVPPPPPPKAVEPEKPSPKPDIAVAKKPEPKPKPKPKAEPPKRDKDFEKRMREQLAQEQQVVAQADAERRERELKALIAKREANARSKALAEWQDKIRAKIRGNIILPLDIRGNPEAIFQVSLLPTGEVLPGSVRQTRSSGNAAYDDAVHRAILRSSPLPKPDDPRLFVRQLELRFRPQDK